MYVCVDGAKRDHLLFNKIINNEVNDEINDESK